MQRNTKLWLAIGAALLAGVAIAQTATRFAAIRVDNLTANRVVLGGGTSQLTPLGAGTSTTLLHGNASGAPSYGAVSLTADVSGTLPPTTGGTGLATLAQGDLIYGSAADTFSALAKNASATRYLSNTGTSNNPAWAQVNVANGVTGTLPAGNGGLGITSTTDDTVPVGSGSAYVATALTSCSGATSAVTYNTTTNAFGCNSISGGVSQTSATWDPAFSDACTTTPAAQTAAYTVTGNQVSLTWSQTFSCTSDSVNFSTAAGDVPVAIRPTRTVFLVGSRVVDNGANDAGQGCIKITSDGTMSIQRSASSPCSTATWTNTGTKGYTGAASANSWSYVLN